MTASTALTATGTGPVTSSVDAESAREMADQMADVAGALFALLLLQGAQKPVHSVAPDPPGAGPTNLPVALETPAPPVLVPSVPALAVALAALDLDPSPVPSGMPSIAMPASLSMPESAPHYEAELVAEEVVTPHTIQIPVIAPPAVPTMAMLSEIEFLDE